MEPPIAGQLRVEGGRQHAPLAHGDGPAVRRRAPAPRRPAPTSLTTGARMKTPCSGSSPSAGMSRSASKRVELAPVGVALDRDVRAAEGRLVAVGEPIGQQDHAGAGAEHRRAAAAPWPGSARAGRSGRSAGAWSVDSPPGRISASRPSRSRGQADLHRLGANVAHGLGVLAHVALQRQDADSAWRRRQPRSEGADGARLRHRCYRAALPAADGQAFLHRHLGRARARASARPGRRSPRPGSRGCRSGWWPSRSPAPRARGPPP